MLNIIYVYKRRLQYDKNSLPPPFDNNFSTSSTSPFNISWWSFVDFWPTSFSWNTTVLNQPSMLSRRSVAFLKWFSLPHMGRSSTLLTSPAVSLLSLQVRTIKRLRLFLILHCVSHLRLDCVYLLLCTLRTDWNYTAKRYFNRLSIVKLIVSIKRFVIKCFSLPIS